jgi:hypothetical protein
MLREEIVIHLECIGIKLWEEEEEWQPKRGFETLISCLTIAPLFFPALDTHSPLALKAVSRTM